MKINQLKVLAAVAELHSFNETARLLSVSQPAIAKAIRELENWAGRQLVVRSSRGARLTPDGIALLREARGLLDHVSRVENAFAHDRSREQINLGVTSPAGLAITPTLSEFRKQNPQVGLTVLSGGRRSIFEELYNYAVDFVVVTLPDGMEDVPAGLTVKPLMRLPTSVTVAKGDPLTQARSLADLADAEWLCCESEEIFHHQLRDAFRQAGLDRLPLFTRIEPPLMMLTLGARRGAVCVWTGLAPHMIDQHTRSLGASLVILNLRETLPETTVCLIYRSDLIVTAAMQRLLDQMERTKNREFAIRNFINVAE